MCEEGGRSGRGPRRVLTSRILLSPTRPRMQGILRLFLSRVSLVSSHVSFVSVLCRLVLVSSRFCDSPAAVFISSRFVSPRACLVSLLSHHHFVSCRVCLVRSRGPSLLDSFSLGLLVSRCLISWSLGPWSLGLLISWSPVGLLISGALDPWVSWSLVYVLYVFTRVGV